VRMGPMMIDQKIILDGERVWEGTFRADQRQRTRYLDQDQVR